MKLKTFFIGVSLLCIGSLFAEGTLVNGIYYNFNEIALTAEVTYKGSGYSEDPERYVGSVVIPNSVTYGDKTYAVTSIGTSAFLLCSKLTSITIPTSITNIGWAAFMGTSLTKTNYIGTIADWCKINFVSSFSNPTNCSQNLYINNLKVINVIIPDGIEKINNYTFINCADITSVNIPNSITHIGDNAFKGTAWLDNQPDGIIYINKCLYQYKGTMPENTVITIQDGTIQICGFAFYNYINLNLINIPNSVTDIGESAFYSCTGLTSVTIPNSVKAIGSYAFSGCTGLTSVTIPNSVTTIGIEAFSGCDGLTSVKCLAETPPSLYYDYSSFSLFSRKDTLCVPCNSIEAYKVAYEWKYFKVIKCISAEPVNVDNVTAVSDSTSVSVSWPMVTGTVTYVLTLYNNGTAFCTLTFNASGVLLSAKSTLEETGTQSAGFAYTVTGLMPGTKYTYTMLAKDGSGGILSQTSGSFTTKGLTGLTETKLIEGVFVRDGKLVIENNANVDVYVYNSVGQLINYELRIANYELSVPQGLYIVKVGNGTMKIVVK